MQSKHTLRNFFIQVFIKLTPIMALVLTLNAYAASNVHEHIEESSHSGSWMQVNGDEKIKVVAKQVAGPVTTNDAETDVLVFPSNASILVNIQGQQDLEMEIKREGLGAIQAQYKVDGKLRPREKMTDAQLQSLWQQFFRRTGHSHKERATRIVKKDGIDALITEVKKLKSSMVVRKYVSNISESYELNAKQFDKIISIIAGIRSNSESRRAYLSVLNGNTVLTESQLISLINASASISSNSTLSDLLSKIVDMDIPVARTKNGKLTHTFVDALLKASTGIRSHSKLASFIVALIRNVDDQDSLAQIIAMAKDNISSNSALSDLYKKINEMGLSESNVRLLITSASAGIGSNSKLGDLFQNISQRSLSQDNTRVLIQAAAENIGSSSSLGDLLIGIAQSDNFAPELMDDLVQASENVGSTYQREKLLKTLLRKKS